MTYRHIIGNLLNSKEKYIVHQTNCVSRGSAAGLAKIIFNTYKYADCYIDRVYNDTPGTIDIRGDGKDNRFIVNLMGQYMPGGLDRGESSDARESYFVKGLKKLSLIPNLKSVAFPAGIGCAIAGGNWEKYVQYIEQFYLETNKDQKVDVTIYCLPMNVNQFSFEEKTY